MRGFSEKAEWPRTQHERLSNLNDKEEKEQSFGLLQNKKSSDMIVTGIPETGESNWNKKNIQVEKYNLV